MIVGGLLLAMGIAATLVRRLPLSPAMFYLPVGYLLGPSGAGMVDIDAQRDAHLLAQVAEAALLVSLFTVGLQMRVPLRDRLWLLPVRLGVTAMLLTIALLTPACQLLLGLPAGAALLVAAVLAPTDPVLASDVQVRAAGDRDRIRFSLTGEGGLNDGSTYPFIMLGLGLIGLPEAQAFATPAAVPRALWGALAGLAVGWGLGRLVGALWINLRGRFRMALGMEEFFTLGLIALAYGVAGLVLGIGFVAVFAAGLAVRQIEFAVTGGQREPAEVIGHIVAGAEDEVATDPVKAPAWMTETVLGFNRQLEHLAELAMVLLLGVLLSTNGWSGEGLLLAAVLFFVVRPCAVGIALLGSRTSRLQRLLTGWFGIRGVGSLYYLFVIQQFPLEAQDARRLASIVLTVLATSIVVHGISATPLMELYQNRRRRP